MEKDLNVCCIVWTILGKIFMILKVRNIYSLPFLKRFSKILSFSCDILLLSSHFWNFPHEVAKWSKIGQNCMSLKKLGIQEEWIRIIIGVGEGFNELKCSEIFKIHPSPYTITIRRVRHKHVTKWRRTRHNLTIRAKGMSPNFCHI